VKKGFFITGTGTGVGKTFITAMLAEQARAAGQRVFAFKPIESGCLFVDGKLVGSDQEMLAKAAGDWQRDDLRHLYCFEHPLAPLAAAHAIGVAIDLARIETTFAIGAADADIVLVEGAGGWRVPITEAEDMGALAKRLGLPVIVVAGPGLGTINHTLLTIEAIERDGCSIAQVVLSCRPEDDVVFARENVAEIRRRSRCYVELSNEFSDVTRTR
jgi:dethiobiotin synthetase